MSWSDDTRCLYCEGRLPLYRKITHGQFCSSGHRKSYWQDQERLAVERLHQTHNTLNAHRLALPDEAPGPLLEPTPLANAAFEESRQALPDLAFSHVASDVVSDVVSNVVSDAVSDVPQEPETFELSIPDPCGMLSPHFAARNGNAAELMVADPIEYEVSSAPLPPTALWAVPAAKGLPEGNRVAAWRSVSPKAWASQIAATQAVAEVFAGVLSHPASLTPTLALAAGRSVALRLGSRPADASEPLRAALEPIEVALAPCTHVALHVAPQNDALVQLLDQQVPRPDQLLALSRFVAHQHSSAAAIPSQEALNAPAETVLPVAFVAAIAPRYEFATAALRSLPAGIAPQSGSFACVADVSAIEAQPQVGISPEAMPSIAESSYQIGFAGLHSLPTGMLVPAQGAFAACAAESEVALGASADLSKVDLARPMVSAAASTLAPRLAHTCSLPSAMVVPAQGVFARQASVLGHATPEHATAASPDFAWPQVFGGASALAPGLSGMQSLPSGMVSAAASANHAAVAQLELDLSSAVSADLALPVTSRPAGNVWTPRASGLVALPFGAESAFGENIARPEPMARVIPQAVETHPLLPESRLEPMDRKPAEDALRGKGAGAGSFIRGHGLEKLEPAWAHATGFWQHAPRDLKLLLFAIPALLALVFHPGLPRVASAGPQSAGGFPSQITHAVSEQFVNVRTTLENRAAIALDEDFRSGLDNWVSPGGSTTEWSFDQTGFVQPGPLALYRPSVMLTDYQLQFMGLIDKKALSWVVRAADFENFYVIKLTVTKAGPVPSIGLTRYAVINGKAEDRHDVNIPLNARPDTVYAVRMDVRGSNFSVEVQGQMADSWTETHLTRGGVGFFTARGEASRVRWVQITHQYDMLGRLCAYLAPYDTTNGSWQP